MALNYVVSRLTTIDQQSSTSNHCNAITSNFNSRRVEKLNTGFHDPLGKNRSYEPGFYVYVFSSHYNRLLHYIQ